MDLLQAIDAIEAAKRGEGSFDVDEMTRLAKAIGVERLIHLHAAAAETLLQLATDCAFVRDSDEDLQDPSATPGQRDGEPDPSDEPDC